MKPTRSLVLAGGVLAAFSACALAQAPASDFVWPDPAAPLPGPVAAAVASIRPGSLGAHIAFLASPAMEGRGLGTRGLDAAAEYVASSLAAAGVPPLTPADKGTAATASYFHPVPLRAIAHQSGQLVVEVRGEGATTRTFLSGLDCVLPPIPPGAIAAPVVFAGYGIQEKVPSRDDYLGLDVRGKIVLLVAGLPPGPEWQAPGLVARYGAAGVRQRFAAKAALAASLGARAVLAIEGPDFPAPDVSGEEAAETTFYLPLDTDAVPPVIRVSRAVARALLGGDGLTGEATRGLLAGASATIRAGGEERLVASRNVLAMIPGSDPKLRDEAVVIGAHMDHLGRTGDRYYPGADDNASGTSALLEIARALAAARPKRTVVFAFWTGEEEGHLGSVHYVRNPAWPLDRTTVYLNLDMIAHPWTQDELRTLVADARLEKGAEFLAKVKPADFIELGVADWTRDLDAVLARAARGTGLALHFDRTDGRSGGSDYRDFARQGRPFVRFFGNYFDGYHEPIDTADKVDAGQVAKVARLALAAAWMFAER